MNKEGGTRAANCTRGNFVNFEQAFKRWDFGHGFGPGLGEGYRELFEFYTQTKTL